VRSFPAKRVRKPGEAVKGGSLGLPDPNGLGRYRSGIKTKKRPRIGPRPPF
jgi:hypothetical protein